MTETNNSMMMKYIDSKLLFKYSFDEIIEMTDQEVVSEFGQSIEKYNKGQLSEANILTQSIGFEYEQNIACSRIERLNFITNTLYNEYPELNCMSEQKKSEMKQIVKDYVIGKISLDEYTLRLSDLFTEHDNNNNNIEIKEIIDHYLGKTKYPTYWKAIMLRLSGDEIDYLKKNVNDFYDEKIKMSEFLENIFSIEKRIECIYSHIICRSNFGDL